MEAAGAIFHMVVPECKAQDIEAHVRQFTKVCGYARKIKSVWIKYAVVLLCTGLQLMPLTLLLESNYQGLCAA